MGTELKTHDDGFHKDYISSRPVAATSGGRTVELLELRQLRQSPGVQAGDVVLPQTQLLELAEALKSERGYGGELRMDEFYFLPAVRAPSQERVCVCVRARVAVATAGCIPLRRQASPPGSRRHRCRAPQARPRLSPRRSNLR